MDPQPRLASLRQKHEGLKEAIKREEARLGTDHLDIVKLKREKLHIKEEIQKLAGHALSH